MLRIVIPCLNTFKALEASITTELIFCIQCRLGFYLAILCCYFTGGGLCLLWGGPSAETCVNRNLIATANIPSLDREGPVIEDKSLSIGMRALNAQFITSFLL